ncbi:MAG TPA: AI-2E family transporter [Acidimicrobiales bacterium]|nr:AI-2E family transporter [Acidimicrobiales bacterium]
MAGSSEVHGAEGAVPQGEPTSFVPPPGPAVDPETYRGRLSAAAHRRGVPLATIVTAVVVVFLVMDLNALAILLLWVLRTVVLYAVVAFFIALLLAPAVRLVQRVVPARGWAVTIVFLVATAVFIGIVVLFTAPLVTAVTHFAHQLPTLVKQAEHGRGRIGHLLQRFHLQQWVTKNAPKLANDIAHSLKPAQALSVGKTALSSLVALGTIAVLSLFALLEAPVLRSGLLSLLKPARGERVLRVYEEASRSVTGYMLGNALTSVIAGVIIFVTLAVMGVPYPLLLGLWVALVDLLPLIGGLLAGVPVVIIAAFHSIPALIVTLVVFLVYQQVENHVLNPLIMSRTVRLNPLWVLVAVLVGATLGGRVGAGLGTFVGALIGIPVGGAIQVAVREIRKGPGGGGAVAESAEDLRDVPSVP